MKTERVSNSPPDRGLSYGGRGATRRASRRGDKKLTAPVTLFAAIEAEQHEALRAIAFSQHRSLADVVREALSGFISQQAAHKRLSGSKR